VRGTTSKHASCAAKRGADGGGSATCHARHPCHNAPWKYFSAFDIFEMVYHRRMENDPSRPARILVLYYSAQGHTQAMAELVATGARGVPQTEVRLKTVDEAVADDLRWCDGIAVGSPTHMGTIAWEMKRWWDVVAQPLWYEIEGKIGCAFSSSGGAAGGGELTCLALQIVLMNYGLLVFGVPDYVAPGQTLHYGATCAGKPRNEGESEACRRLGRRLAEWTQTMILHRPEHDPRKATYQRLF
jgi:NAD(P)H dehydrogenase (quinone)